MLHGPPGTREFGRMRLSGWDLEKADGRRGIKKEMG